MTVLDGAECAGWFILEKKQVYHIGTVRAYGTVFRKERINRRKEVICI
jgi:hypothetical protein